MINRFLEAASLILLIGTIIYSFIQYDLNIESFFNTKIFLSFKIQLDNDFIQWAIKFNKLNSYKSYSEYIYRKNIFLSNHNFIDFHNQKFRNKQQTFELSHNYFSDLTNQQFKKMYTGLNHDINQIRPNSQYQHSKTQKCNGKIQILENLPKQVSWKQKAVTKVRFQGNCGSCWAFSAIGTLQGLHFIESGKLQLLSPQQLVDCAKGYGQNDGCNGGEMDAAMWYVKDNGIALDSNYPYKGDRQKCSYDKQTMKQYQIKDCAQVPANNSKALMSAVYKQPVSISVQADGMYFQFYRKGIFNKKCGDKLDHGMVLTGYGVEKKQYFWQCKNSWGVNWGDNGYILIQRDDKEGPGLCGILMQNSVPLN